MERQIKGWGRAKKKALITADWRKLQVLAKRPTARVREDAAQHHACFEAPPSGAPQHDEEGAFPGQKDKK